MENFVSVQSLKEKFAIPNFAKFRYVAKFCNCVRAFATVYELPMKLWCAKFYLKHHTRKMFPLITLKIKLIFSPKMNTKFLLRNFGEISDPTSCYKLAAILLCRLSQYATKYACRCKKRTFIIDLNITQKRLNSPHIIFLLMMDNPPHAVNHMTS
jgi:hypothetical protein